MRNVLGNKLCQSACQAGKISHINPEELSDRPTYPGKRAVISALTEKYHLDRRDTIYRIL
jgi:hypothetical protein